MVIFQAPDLARRRAHFTACEIRTVWEIALDDIETVHLHPRDTGGAIVSVDEARPWESWRWGGPHWRDHLRTARVTGIAGVEIQSGDPSGLSQRWSQIFELELERDGDDTLRLPDGGWISFCPDKDGRGEGIRTVALHALDANAVREAAAERKLPIEADGAVVVGGTRLLPV